jgi:hypothetical protein
MLHVPSGPVPLRVCTVACTALTLPSIKSSSAHGATPPAAHAERSAVSVALGGKSVLTREMLWAWCEPWYSTRGRVGRIALDVAVARAQDALGHLGHVDKVHGACSSGGAYTGRSNGPSSYMATACVRSRVRPLWSRRGPLQPQPTFEKSTVKESCWPRRRSLRKEMSDHVNMALSTMPRGSVAR